MSAVLSLCSLVWLAAGCARSLPSTTLEPSATVAAVGFDAIEVAATSSDVAEPSLSPESEAAPPGSDRTQLSVTPDREAGWLEVESQGVERVTLRVTMVSVGEALAFLAGGRLVRVPDLVRVVPDAGSAPQAQRRLDVGPLLEQDGGGLLAVVVEGTPASGSEPCMQTRTLVQMGPLRLQAEQRPAGEVHVALTGPSGEPITGAAVELIDADGRVLSESLTGTRGQAVLERLASPVLPPALLGVGLFVVASLDDAHTLIELR